MSKALVFKKAALLTDKMQEVKISEPDDEAIRKDKKDKKRKDRDLEVDVSEDEEEVYRREKKARKEQKRAEKEAARLAEEEAERKKAKKAAKKAKKEAKKEAKKAAKAFQDESDNSTEPEEVEWVPKALPVVEPVVSQKGQYWKRIDESAYFDKADVKDNSHWTAKKGGDSWGERAAHDLIAVKGRGFRKEMQKKKRASWIGGGSLETGVNSIVYDDSD